MAHPSNDVLNEDLLREAAHKLQMLAARQRDESLTELAEVVVHEVFRLCLTEVPDAMEGHRTTTHAALVDEVVARVRRATRADQDQRLAEASTESFPASDPPAWIYAH